MKIIIRMGIFSLLGILLFVYCQKVFSPKWINEFGGGNRRVATGFYAEKKESLDVLIMGASQFATGISPMDLYKEQGIAAYNISMDMQDISATYYWLKEACRYQTPKIVVLEVQMLYRDSTEAFVRQSIDCMKLSPNKMEAITEICKQNPEYNFSDYVFPLLYYHTRWNKLTEEDFVFPFSEKHYSKKGYNLKPKSMKQDYNGITYDNVSEEKIDIEKQEWLDKIFAYCQEHQIEIILGKSPRPDSYWSAPRSVGVNKIAQKNDIPFLDFNEKSLYKEVGFIGEEDYSDGGHLNIWGAKKMTAYMGEYLRANYSLPDRRQDSQYTSWNEDLVLYEREFQGCELNACTDFEEYLDRIQDKGYTTYIAAKDEYTSALNETLRAKLNSLGLNTSNFNNDAANYLAVIRDGKSVYEVYNTEAELRYSGKIDDITYHLMSACNQEENNSSIVIDATEYSVNKTGLNIVVYDQELDRVVDSVCFNTSGKLECSR